MTTKELQAKNQKIEEINKLELDKLEGLPFGVKVVIKIHEQITIQDNEVKIDRPQSLIEMTQYGASIYRYDGVVKSELFGVVDIDKQGNEIVVPIAEYKERLTKKEKK